MATTGSRATSSTPTVTARSCRRPSSGGRRPRTGISDNDPYVSDDERDEDADGLTNYDETNGRMSPEYWEGCYSIEAPYPITYPGTSPVDGDSDGDGILDGADDQDFDDVPNIMELSRNMASGAEDIQGNCHVGVSPPRSRMSRARPT